MLGCPLEWRRAARLAAAVAATEAGIVAVAIVEAKVVEESAVAKAAVRAAETRVLRTRPRSSATTASSTVTMRTGVLTPRRTHRRGAAPLALLQLPVAPALPLRGEAAVGVAAEATAEARVSVTLGPERMARQARAHQQAVRTRAQRLPQASS